MAKTVIVVKEQPRHNQYQDVIEVRLTGENEILVNMIKDTTALGKPVALPLKFTYHPEAGYAPLREVMADRNDRIKEFYWRAWFGNETLDFDVPVTSKFDGGNKTISGPRLSTSQLAACSFIPHTFIAFFGPESELVSLTEA